jgi:hypothetical protein
VSMETMELSSVSKSTVRLRPGWEAVNAPTVMRILMALTPTADPWAGADVHAPCKERHNKFSAS